MLTGVIHIHQEPESINCFEEKATDPQKTVYLWFVWCSSLLTPMIAYRDYFISPIKSAVEGRLTENYVVIFNTAS